MRFSSFSENNNPGGGDISILEGESASRLLAGSHEEVSPALSPDGRWLAYESDETGQPEIYVTRYPGPAGSRLISVNGGREPLWSRDGRELFYNQGDFLVVVPVESTDSALKTGPPKVLFEVPYAGLDRGGMGYDVSPDGERFVMLQLKEGSSSHINVVVNWTEEFERLVPTE